MLKGLFRRGAVAEAPSAVLEESIEPAAARRVLRIGVLTQIGEFDPLRLRDTATALVLSQVFETLYAFSDAASGLQPLLASGLPRALDGEGRRYAIPIRGDLAFSDGTPLTPQLVVAWLSRPGGFSSHAELTARDGEIEVALRAPNPNFALFLTQPATGIAIERGGRFLGTGPFVLPEGSLASVRESEEITLPRNPNDREAAATGVDELHVRRYPNAEALAAALNAGEVHFCDALPATGFEVKSTRIYPVTRSGVSTGILFVNAQRVADRRVRQAIVRAVGRTEVARRSYDAMSIAYVTNRLLPAALGEEGVGFPEADPGAAKRHLAEASKIPSKLTLLTTWGPKAYMPRPRQAAEAVRDQIGAALGIEVEIVMPDRNGYYLREEAGEYDLLLAGWIPDTPDPSDFYESLLSSSAIPGDTHAIGTANNLSRFADEAADRLLAEHRADPTVARRTALSRYVADQGLLTPLLLGKFVAYVSWDVKKVTVSALGEAHFRGATVHA